MKRKAMERKVLISLLIPDFYSQKAKETYLVGDDLEKWMQGIKFCVCVLPTFSTK